MRYCLNDNACPGAGVVVSKPPRRSGAGSGKIGNVAGVVPIRVIRVLGEVGKLTTKVLSGNLVGIGEVISGWLDAEIYPGSQFAECGPELQWSELAVPDATDGPLYQQIALALFKDAAVVLYLIQHGSEQVSKVVQRQYRHSNITADGRHLRQPLLAPGLGCCRDTEDIPIQHFFIV